MTDESKVDEVTSLAAQLPPVALDEVPGMLSLRDLSAGEQAQYAADANLIRSIAPVTPYVHAAEAVLALGDVVDALEAEPSARARRRLARALHTAAHALRVLPAAFAKTIPRDEAFAEAVATLEANESFRQAAALHETAPDELSREAAQRHLVLMHVALDAAARLAARWLLAQSEAIDTASRRIARLGGEVIEGVPAVLTIRTRYRDEGGEPDVVGFVPDFLPLLEMQNLQAALRKAKDLLANETPEPALRGARAMYGEQVAATLDLRDETPDDDGEDQIVEPDPAARPLDVGALIAHLFGGAIRLEQAWSRAVEREDVACLVGEWVSLLHAMAGDVAQADRDLHGDEARFELPLPQDDLLALPLDGDDQDGARRTAEALALAWIAHGVDALQRPTNLAHDTTGGAVAFFSSGAFARVRDQLGLLDALRSDRPADRAPALVQRAALHGDPEAVVLHAAALLRRRGDVARPVQNRIVAAADRLVAGEETPLATITLLADAALRLISDS